MCKPIHVMAGKVELDLTIEEARALCDELSTIVYSIGEAVSVNAMVGEPITVTYT